MDALLSIGGQLIDSIETLSSDAEGRYVVPDSLQCEGGGLVETWVDLTLLASVVSVATAEGERVDAQEFGKLYRMGTPRPMLGLRQSLNRIIFGLPKRNRDRWRATISQAELRQLQAALRVVKRYRDTTPEDRLAVNMPSEVQSDRRSDLPPRVDQAGESVRWLEEEVPDLFVEPMGEAEWKALHSHLREHGGPYPVDERDNPQVPAFDTWRRYVREYKSKVEGVKRSSRRGRVGRSMINPDGSRADGKPA